MYPTPKGCRHSAGASGRKWSLCRHLTYKAPQFENWTSLASMRSCCKLRLLVRPSLPLPLRIVRGVRALQTTGRQTAYATQPRSSVGKAALGPICGVRRRPLARSLLDRVWYTTMTGANGGVGQNGLHLANRLNESRSPYVSPRYVVRRGRHK